MTGADRPAGPSGTPPARPLTLADHYDAELQLHHRRLQAAIGIGPTDRVLDVGCGAGQTTSDAARAARSGSVLGVDISEQMLERARRLTAAEGLSNVTYERGDAQVHRFAPAHFDVVISLVRLAGLDRHRPPRRLGRLEFLRTRADQLPGRGRA